MAWVRRSGKDGKGKTWIACWRDSSGAVVSKGGFRRKEDARDFGEDRESDIRRGIYIDPRDLKRAQSTTLGDFWTTWRWLAGERAETSPSARPGPRTLALYDDIYRPLISPTFAATPIGRISRRDVQAWLDALEVERGYWRARDALRVLRALLNHAVHQEPPLLQRNPAARIRLAEPETHDPAVLTPDEVERLADALGPEWRAFAFLIAYGGLRPSEAVALRVERVDWLRNAIRVEEKLSEHNGRLYGGAPKTGRSRRRVPVPAFVVEELSALLARRPASDDGLIFHRNGCPIILSHFRRRGWRRALIAAQLDPAFPLKNLRHTGASLAIAGGAPKDYVAARLGHVGTRMVDQHYRAYFEGIEREIADRLGEMREERQDVSARLRDSK